MPSPIDLAERKDLSRLVDLVAAMRNAWPAGEPLLVGATARDILLSYAHGIPIQRATFDIDFAVAVETWDHFKKVREALLGSADFAEVSGMPHRLLFKRDTKLDLIPFGGVERPDRTIAWPPKQDEVMHVLGYREAMRDAVDVLLPSGQQIKTVSLPALAVLKIFAWRDRRRRSPGKDAADLWTILCNYLQAGNEDRLYAEHTHLFDEPDYDYLRAGAWLLGRDIRALLDSDADDFALDASIEHLSAEIDPAGPTRLARDMRGAAAQEALNLLIALDAGLKGFRSP